MESYGADCKDYSKATDLHSRRHRMLTRSMAAAMSRQDLQAIEMIHLARIHINHQHFEVIFSCLDPKCKSFFLLLLSTFHSDIVNSSSGNAPISSSSDMTAHIFRALDFYEQSIIHGNKWQA